LGLAACVLLCASSVRGSEKSCDDLVHESERLWTKYKFDESDKLLDKAMKICPERAELYWRKARNEFYRIEAIPRGKKPDKDVLIKRYTALEALADKCIELDDKDGICWLAKGAAIGRRSTTRGVLKCLWNVADVERAWLKAVSLAPKYRSEKGTTDGLADSYNALGIFYRSVPEWLCYFPLKQIIGTCGDKAKSVGYQRKAVELAPARIEYQKELAVSLLCHGQTYDNPGEIDEAKGILMDLQSLPEIKPYDKIDKEHARMLLKNPSLACGYQRDTQQELSKEAYENNK